MFNEKKSKYYLWVIIVSLLSANHLYSLNCIERNSDIDTNIYVLRPIGTDEIIYDLTEYRISNPHNDHQLHVEIKTDNNYELKKLAESIGFATELIIFIKIDLDLEYLIDCLLSENSKSLNYLYIDSKYVIDLPENILKFEKLEALYIVMPLIEFPNYVYNLKNLKELKFANCNFCEVPKGISKLENLVYLSIFNCKVYSIPKDIIYLNHLKDLEFYYCKNINFDNVLKKVSKMNKITDLTFYECNITNLSEIFFKLKNIERICLIGNYISDEDKEKLKSKLPNTIISF